MTVEAFNWLRDSQKRQAASEEAENRWYAGQMGQEYKEAEEEMGNFVLGDITQPPPVIVQPPPQQSNTLGTIAAIVAAMATGGILGPTVLSALKPTAPTAQPMQQPQSYTDSTVNIGLGKLENYEGLKP